MVEVNLDGLVGPTHHHGGLGMGNVASHVHEGQPSSPRAAALQGLDKMARLASLGVPQGILPPAPRPALELLRSAGFKGSIAELVGAASRKAPLLLSAAYSASSMWAANAATVSPAPDSADGRTHLSIANLVSSLHRSIEPPWTERVLRAVFSDPQRFVVHAPLLGGLAMRDEGAANHMRLFSAGGDTGLQIFVYGVGRDEAAESKPQRRFPRQTRLASEAIARRHELADEATFFLPQHPSAIDAGVFHNDVIATSCRDVLLFHEHAFAPEFKTRLAEIAAAYERRTDSPLRLAEIMAKDLPLEDAVASYLFNSQIVAEGGGAEGPLVIIAPAQCGELPTSRAVLRRLVEEGTVARFELVELRESMQNGGGPACLRLRVQLQQQDLPALPPRLWWTEATDRALRECINRHYRDELTLTDLADPQLAEEAQTAHQEILRILGLDPLID